MQKKKAEDQQLAVGAMAFNELVKEMFLGSFLDNLTPDVGLTLGF